MGEANSEDEGEDDSGVAASLSPSSGSFSSVPVLKEGDPRRNIIFVDFPRSQRLCVCVCVYVCASAATRASLASPLFAKRAAHSNAMQRKRKRKRKRNENQTKTKRNATKTKNEKNDKENENENESENESEKEKRKRNRKNQMSNSTLGGSAQPVAFGHQPRRHASSDTGRITPPPPLAQRLSSTRSTTISTTTKIRK